MSNMTNVTNLGDEINAMSVPLAMNLMIGIGTRSGVRVPDSTIEMIVAHTNALHW